MALPTLQNVLQSSAQRPEYAGVPTTIQYWRNRMAEAQARDAEKAGSFKSAGKAGLEMNKQFRDYAVARVYNPQLTFKQFTANPKVSAQWVKKGAEMVANDPSLGVKTKDAWKMGIQDIFDKNRWARGVMKDELASSRAFPSARSVAGQELEALRGDTMSGVSKIAGELGDIGVAGADASSKLAVNTTPTPTDITYTPTDIDPQGIASTESIKGAVDMLKDKGYIGGDISSPVKSAKEVSGLKDTMAGVADDTSKASFMSNPWVKGPLAGLGLASSLMNMQKRGLTPTNALGGIGSALTLASLIPGLQALALPGMLTGGAGGLSGLSKRNR